MLDKFREAISLFSSNIRLFSLIILTIWLPGNIIINYLDYYVFYEEDFIGSMRTVSLIEGVFSPIYETFYFLLVEPNMRPNQTYLTQTFNYLN